jgi:hypothetical protein
VFQREGADLHCEMPISFAKAALGGEIEIPTLDGHAKVKVPPETQTGQVFRLRNKGIRPVRGSVTGDLYCHVAVETPVKPTARQKELLRDGKLYIRVIHAHNDWLEMLADWGVLGLLPVLAGLLWLGRLLIRAFHGGHPETVPLALGLVLMMAHASVDLLFWFTPLMFTAIFIAAAMSCLTDQSSTETARDLS